LRVGRGRSQEDLALEAEVDRSYMSRLERGRVNPTVGVLEQIAGALDAHIVEFLSNRPKASSRRSHCAAGGGSGAEIVGSLAILGAVPVNRADNLGSYRARASRGHAPSSAP
jgi:transcriptional regulator with XRE-family HTH domain